MKTPSRSSSPGKPAATGRLPSSMAERLLANSARGWNLSRSAIVAIVLGPAAIVLTGVASGLAGKPTFKWFTGEDGVAETLQVVCYGATLALSLLVTYRHARGRREVLAVLYALLSCGLVFLIGEEISWGQRILGWTTPATFTAINKQAETNLHNIHGVGDTFKWVQLAVGAYGALLPLLALRTGLFARPFFAAVIPHYTLAPYFGAMFLWKLYRNFFEEPAEYSFAIAEFNEVIELVLAAGFLLFLVHQVKRCRSAAGEETTSAAAPAAKA